MASDDGDEWNHNIHHHPIVLDAVRPGHRRALDVGCGAGRLARDLAATGLRVTALEPHGPILEEARMGAPEGIDFVRGDLLAAPLVPASFDLVASVAVLHHMDTTAGLERMRELVAPGGTIVVVGLARTRSPSDLVHDGAGFVATRYLQRSRTMAEMRAPMVWPPPDTFGRTRDVAERVLPGVRYRRHVLFRYSLTWVRSDA